MTRIIIIIATLCIFLPSCNNTKLLNNSGELQTIPDIVKQGQVIEIVLNGKDLPKDQLFAKIGSFNWNGNHTQYRLRFINANGILKAKFTVPDSSTFLIIDYEKKNEINDFKSVFKIVYEGEKPSLSGLVLSLRNSKDVNELNSLNQYNERLYPNNKLSWGMVYYTKTKRFGLNINENEVDSIYKILKKNYYNIDKNDLFDNLSACFMAYCLNKNWTKALTILKEMKLKNFENVIPSGLALENISLFIKEISIPSYITYESIRISDETKEIFSELYTWDFIYNTNTLRNATLKRIDSLDANSVYFKKFIESQFQFYLNIDHRYPPYDLSNFYHLTEILMWRREYSNAISIGLEGKSLMEKFVKVDNWDTTVVVEGLMEPIDGLYLSLLLLISSCAEKNNDDSLAISIHKQIINYSNELCNDNALINGPKSLSAIYLSHLYIKSNQFESAKESLKKAFDLKSPFANSTFEHLQKSLTLVGLDTLILNNFLKNSYDNLYPIAPDFIINSSIKRYNIKDSNNSTTFCFFLSGNCSACNDPIFNAIDELNSKKTIDKNIIVFAKKEQFKYFNETDNNVSLVEINNSINKKFEINKLPYFIVIKSGRIIGINQNIPTNKNVWLYYLGILKSPKL